MKVYNLYKLLKSVWIISLFLGIASCADDSLVSNIGTEEGELVPVKVLLSAPEAQSEVSSRATDEFAIEDLYLFVFNSSGTLKLKKYYTAADLQKDPNQQNGVTGENNYVVETLPSGKAYIYAFANLGSSVYKAQLGNNADSDLKDFLENNFELGSNSLSDLRELKLKVEENHRDLQRGDNYMLMSGTCAESDDGTYTIAKDKEIKTIKLRRVDSKITFNFKTEEGSSFKATRWYIVNAPAYSYFLERTAGSSSEESCTWDAANEGESDFYTTFVENENDLPAVDNNDTFTFYMPENRKYGAVGISSYEDRERQAKDADGKNGAFQYAPANGTYVVIKGIYEGEANSEKLGPQSVYAYVTYKIHLGYVDTNAADFFSKRNVKYTYNVTVKGVDHIVLEVETAGDDEVQEKSPGATGEVIFSGGTKIYNLDAHYEQILLSFNKEELKKMDAGEFSCLVTTPFTNGVVDDADLDWVKVKKNENASGVLQKYDAGSGLQSVQEMLTDLYDYSLGNKKDEEGFFDGSGNVTYTCFVNEFYYDKAPDNCKISVRSDVPLWKYFVNQADRKMYIVCHTDLSKDEESSIVSAEYVIAQRAIQTFYNYSDFELTRLRTAYGVETINETGWLEWGTETTDSDDEDYGWGNTKKMIPTMSWNNLIDFARNGYLTLDQNERVNKTVDDESMIALANHYNESTYYLNGMSDSYKKAYIACMQRNRDNNGDGTIDDDEIRWYLPAINQYKAMYIGEAGLSRDARLYFYPTEFFTSDGVGKLKHYASSTVTSDKTPQILWAEEGTSTSSLKQRIEYNVSFNLETWNSWKAKTIHYRCVRNLGTVSGNYDNYVHRSSTGGNTVIDPLYINKNQNSVRTSVSGELSSHTYQEYENRLYGKFEVNMTTRPTSNLTKAITVPTTVYTYTYKTRTVTERRDSSGAWGSTSYTDWTTPEVSPPTEEEPTEGTKQDNWVYYNNGRTRTCTETEISNVIKKTVTTLATGCEKIEVAAGEAKWRAPNLREFTLMSVYSSKINNEESRILKGSEVCRTRMGYDNYRKGWYWNSDIITMGSNSYDYGDYIRCVRDIVE